MSKNNAVKREAKKYQGCDFKPSNVIEYEKQKYKLQPLNESQRNFISSLLHDEMVIGAGVAGTGKTYIASRIAGKLYSESKNIKRIILTRPNVEVGKPMGHLPGEIEDKYKPYLEPFEKGLKDELGSNKLTADLWKNILPQPLAYMRGKTFDDAIICLDEAQNMTIAEMKMFITRVGTNSRLFITGDHSSEQDDLRIKVNGLQWLVNEIKRQNVAVEVVEFKKEDCVRSGLCKQMLELISRSDA